MSIVHTALNGILDLLYPPVCLVCRKSLDSGCLCDDCLAEVEPMPEPRCLHCGGPGHAGLPQCRVCRAGENPQFHGMSAIGAHSGPLRQAVLLLKYHQKAQLAEPLGAALAEALLDASQATPAYPAATLPVDLIAPVPLSPSRLRSRGYNQAELLAHVVARRLDVPLDAGLLLRTRQTPTQTTLTHDRRAENVKGAFAARNGGNVAGKTVLLIDDVITTASTIRECARVLREAGAKAVTIASVTQEA